MCQALYIHCSIFILISSLWGKCYYYPHFTDKEPEAQRVQSTLSIRGSLAPFSITKLPLGAGKCTGQTYQSDPSAPQQRWGAWMLYLKTANPRTVTLELMGVGRVRWGTQELGKLVLSCTVGKCKHRGGLLQERPEKRGGDWSMIGGPMSRGKIPNWRISFHASLFYFL